MNDFLPKLNLLLVILVLTATSLCGRPASADVQVTINAIENNVSNKSDRVERYLDELTGNTASWTNSERVALIRKLAEHLRFLGPLHGSSLQKLDTQLWKKLLQEGFQAASNDLNICFSLCQIYINERDYARALPVAEAYAGVSSRGHPHNYAAPAFLEWCRSHGGGYQGVGRPVFDLHFVVITSNPRAHAAMTESRCRAAAHYLTREFRSLSGEQLAEFRFKSLTPYDVASATGYDNVLAYGDITENSVTWNTSDFIRTLATCNDVRMKDSKAINCYIHDYGERENGVWNQENGCCHGRCNDCDPVIVFDWRRLLTREQTPEAHEMGHGFGLPHVAIPGAQEGESTNIMGSSREGFVGSGGERNMGFTEAQVAIVSHCARRIHAAPLNIVVRGIDGRDTHTTGRDGEHRLVFYLQNLGRRVGSVQAFANGVLLRSFHDLAESEERALTVSRTNQVILRAQSGSRRAEKIVALDDRPPTFERIDVLPSPTPPRSVVLSAHGVRDDGYWNTADYRVHLALDGRVFPPQAGISVKMQSLSVGQHSATMRIADGAGRFSAARSTTFTIDGSGPRLSILSPAEDASVRPGGNLGIAIEAGDAQGIMRVALYLDRISDDEFDSTSLGVFPGVFGVGNLEQRKRTVTANWALGRHKLIAVATDNSGATTTVERTFRVALDLPGDVRPEILPERRRRAPDPRQRILPTDRLIVPPTLRLDSQARRAQDGNASRTRRQSTFLFPPQQTRRQDQTSSTSNRSGQESTESSRRRLLPSHRIHSGQEGGRQELLLPTNGTRQRINNVNARSFLDRRGIPAVNERERENDEWARTGPVTSENPACVALKWDGNI